jgi:transcriptional regulator with XRE-family HTH domain
MSLTPATPTIRQLRTRAKLTPTDVERLTEGAVKKGALNAIEQGKVPNPRYNTMSRLAAALGVDVAVCHHAIAATVAARAAGSLAHGAQGRPKAAPMTIATALQTARQLCAALEALAAPSPR